MRSRTAAAPRGRSTPRSARGDDLDARPGRRWLSVVSNCVLIVLKVVAGVLTGSIAILTEAIHSAIDLLASLIALVSVRKAEEPADADHPYGHEKAENVAAGAEAMLILLGAVIIVVEAVRRLINGSEVESVGIGIAIIAGSIVATCRLRLSVPPGPASSNRRRSRATPPTCEPMR